MIFVLDGYQYSLFFHHYRRGHGKRCRLHLGPVKGATVAVLVCQLPSGDVKWVGSELSLCSDLDDFSRPRGAIEALGKLADYCGIVKANPGLQLKLKEIIAGMDKPPAPAPLRPKLGEMAKEELYAKGWEKREARKQGWRGPKRRWEGASGGSV